jgi:formylglycine-generating enzyme required for sulfatase activity
MQCTNCKSEILATAKFCPECGNKVEKKGKTCPNRKCEREDLPQESLFCPDCGVKLNMAETSFVNFSETVNGISYEMIAVKGGSFLMGSTINELGRSNDEIQHLVTLSNFYVGKYAVTQDLWQLIMGNNPSSFKGYNLPVETISWDDCQFFLQRLNQLTGKRYSLPTEAQWEFAARGGTQSKGYIYAGSNNVDEVAEYKGNNNNTTKPVGGKKPNELGLHDMSGNLWEWCQDWKSVYSTVPQSNPPGPSSGSLRVRRGGSWGNEGQRCRAAGRGYDSPSRRNYAIGFRVVLDS